MSAIGKGDFVECIRSADGVGIGRVFRCEGIVRETEDCVFEHGPCGGILINYPSCPPDGWALCCFRPIYRPKPDAFTDLLKIPDTIRETA